MGSADPDGVQQFQEKVIVQVLFNALVTHQKSVMAPVVLTAGFAPGLGWIDPYLSAQGLGL
jgi:hypothetical protein